MRAIPVVLRFVLASGLFAFATSSQAADEAQLVESINAYRSQVQRCGEQASSELPPLAIESRLLLPASGSADLQSEMMRTGYPMANVQAITLAGPRDAQAAMQALRESFCQVVLDPQFVDIGVSRSGTDWRIVLARPLLQARLGNWQAEGQKLLEQINVARAQARQCGGQSFAVASALTWSAALATAAESHSRAMANQNFFAHQGRNGYTPGDRAELAGYTASQVAENIAAGQGSPQRVLDGWLASPGHCANLMNPQLRELGAAYAVDPKSDAGIYWTALFGAP